MDGRLAGRRQAAQGLPGKLQEAKPGRGPVEGQGDEGKSVIPPTLSACRKYRHPLQDAGEMKTEALDVAGQELGRLS